jgi:hypothetical protein
MPDKLPDVRREQLTRDRCVVCGGKIEDPSSLLAVCFACRMDAMVPAWFGNAERYGLSHTFGTHNAGVRPASGVPLLDLASPVRSDALRGLMTEARLYARQLQEQQQGLEHDEGNRATGTVF